MGDSIYGKGIERVEGPPPLIYVCSSFILKFDIYERTLFILQKPPSPLRILYSN